MKNKTCPPKIVNELKLFEYQKAEFAITEKIVKCQLPVYSEN
jgi:hypothetical protein